VALIKADGRWAEPPAAQHTRHEAE